MELTDGMRPYFALITRSGQLHGGANGYMKPERTTRAPDNQEKTMARTEDGEIQEPENSTVDDWFGQNVARDQEVADEVDEEASTERDAEAAFEKEADGEERFKKGHPRPAGVEADGDEVGRDA